MSTEQKPENINTKVERDRYRCNYCGMEFDLGDKFVAHNFKVCLPKEREKKSG